MLNCIPVYKVRVGEDDVKGAPALAEDVVLGGSEDVLVEGAGAAEGLHRGQEVHVALGGNSIGLKLQEKLISFGYLYLRKKAKMLQKR